MPRTLTKTREEARRLYLTGELQTNSEIAHRLKVKPHTVGKWRRDEDWDDLRRKVDRRAAEMFAEKIASDRVTLNVRHYRMWDLLVAKLADELKSKPALEIRELEKISGILDKAQKGQRLAKGLTLDGDTEEAIRAQSEADTRHLIDVFIDTVKEHVHDEDTRERIRQAILAALPEEENEGAGDPDEALVH
jgi:hypothetical protein